MKVAIVGGGASGLFCAGSICENNDVTLFEKNEQLGKKILITGNGRCNVTNAKTNQEFLNNVVTNPKFLHSAIHELSPGQLCQQLTQDGIELVEEENNKIYPKSGKAKTILQWLENRLKKNVVVKFNTTVEKIEKVNDDFLITYNGVTETFNKVIIATGGKTYAVTGSTGDGYEFAKSFNHSVVKPRQSLCALITELEPLLNCAGVQFLCKASIVRSNGSVVCSNTGWVMLTHKGVSGPLTFVLTGLFLEQSIKDHFLSISFVPNLNSEMLNEELNTYVKNNPSKEVFEFVSPFLVKRFAQALKEKHFELLTTKCTSLSKIKKQEIVNLLTNYKIRIKDFDDFAYSVTTKGGVSTSELNPKTMESKITSGLYFLGEVINVDALTGGYSLQIAFSTAQTCANHINSI